MAMKLGIAWGGQIQDALAAHMKTLAEFPPRQKGGPLTPGQYQFLAPGGNTEIRPSKTKFLRQF